MDTPPVLTKPILVEQLSQEPRVYYVKNLLSEAECDGLIDYARPKMKKSTTVNPETGEFILVDSRTSDGTPLALGETEMIQRIESRIAELTQVPIDHGEGLQVIHYEVGGEYQPHFDFFDPNQRGSHVVMRVGGQRIISVIMYLCNVEAGWETIFPQIDVRIKPVKGDAILFYSCLPNGNVDRLSLHGGMPVIQGEKWIATKWIRERPFRESHPSNA